MSLKRGWLPSATTLAAVGTSVLLLLLLLRRELHADLARGHHALHERHGSTAGRATLLLLAERRLLLLLAEGRLLLENLRLRLAKAEG
jgi:hypothetical protein